MERGTTERAQRAASKAPCVSASHEVRQMSKATDPAHTRMHTYTRHRQIPRLILTKVTTEQAYNLIVINQNT